jgi:4-hydroxythreonine-4-phosphate dehydrogenase
MTTTNRQPTAPSRPIIALSMGDPAGIGPELCLTMLTDPTVLAACTPVLFGDATLLTQVAKATHIPIRHPVIPFKEWPGACNHQACIVDMDCLAGQIITPGQGSAASGSAAHRCVVTAATEAISRRVNAIVTAPLSKEALHLAGVPHPGHTELLAALTGTRHYCMMLSSEPITTTLVTTHTALAKVPTLLTRDRILTVIRLTAAAMKTMRGSSPRLTVCGFNPHGGENGLLGTEERDIIAPAVSMAQSEGYLVEGPLPPDTAFLPAPLGRTDAYVCMYHDQGLIPFKMLAFETGVNITLGLPIIRTSPDHGTAFDLAWTGRANPSSMRAAILCAIRLASCR